MRNSSECPHSNFEAAQDRIHPLSPPASSSGVVEMIPSTSLRQTPRLRRPGSPPVSQTSPNWSKSFQIRGGRYHRHLLSQHRPYPMSRRLRHPERRNHRSLQGQPQTIPPVSPPLDRFKMPSERTRPAILQPALLSMSPPSHLLNLVICHPHSPSLSQFSWLAPPTLKL